MSSATEVKAALDSAIADTAEAHSIGKEFSRQRKLPLATVLRLLIGAEGGSLTRILRAAGVDATPSALSQRRAQISPDTFREVFEHFNAVSTDSARFREKYTLLACDGTALSLPRNPDAPSFVTHAGAPEGFNQLHLTPLYNIMEHTFHSAIIQDEAAKDEVGALTTLLKGNLPEQAIILLDRGFESYNLMAHMFNKHVDFVLRVKNSKSAMREVARLPMFELDCDIAFTITTTQTNEDKERHYIHLQVPKKSNPGSKTRRARWDFPSPYPMRLRICRFQIDENGTLETIATSLPRSFTLQDIKELYHLRWGIETGFRDLKYSIGLINIHSKVYDYSIQEVWAALTAFNFTSRIAREAVVRQPPGSAYAYRVNFKNAVALCKEHIRAHDADSEDLVRQIGKSLVAVKPGRQDERNLRVKGFPGFLYRVAA